MDPPSPTAPGAKPQTRSAARRPTPLGRRPRPGDYGVTDVSPEAADRQRSVATAQLRDMDGETSGKRQRAEGEGGNGSGSSRTGAGAPRGASGSGSDAGPPESGEGAIEEELVSDAAPTDLAVVAGAGRRRYLVNRAVLALSSETFRDMLEDCELPVSASGNYAELRVADEEEGPGLRLFLRLMYPRSVAFMSDGQALAAMEAHIPEVIRLADKYNAPGITTICEDILIRILSGVMLARKAPSPAGGHPTWPELDMVKHASRLAVVANQYKLVMLSTRCADFLEQSPVDVVRCFGDTERALEMQELGSVVLSRVLNSYISTQTTHACNNCHYRACPRCGAAQPLEQRFCHICNLPAQF